MLHDANAHPVAPYFAREFPTCCVGIDVEPPGGEIIPASPAAVAGGSTSSPLSPPPPLPLPPPGLDTVGVEDGEASASPPEEGVLVTGDP